jgi:hypothetical protein
VSAILVPWADQGTAVAVHAGRIERMMQWHLLAIPLGWFAAVAHLARRFHPEYFLTRTGMI